VDPNTVIYNPENLFVEDGVSIKAAIINAEEGPVYLGKGAEVQEGTIIQGPFAMGENSQLRLGGKMRPNTTLGPHCKVGGEVGNVIFQDNSNKAHEGFLGNSVIGSWCNLGADTNNSNLKNNYSNVRCWNYQKGTYIDSGLQFCGTIMGDHSKCSINTMLNTGSVIGICTNIHGTGFPPKFVPSFIWGGIDYHIEYDFEKACETAARVMERRSINFDDTERALLEYIFKESLPYRQKVLTQ
jgi:UDP-N-acetylglucosamine diphosphorylase/glucosamine-1-phosphate N-acetyltransferase